jgi:radical SAM protein with 4Fe4S-binding SPASM domain
MSLCFDELGEFEFGVRLSNAIGNRRIPLSGALEVTERCNLACVHCYISQPAADRQRAARELTAGQIASVLDQAVEEGCLWFLFTGGEPFIRADFLDAYRHAKRLGLLIVLFTNATLITPRIADELAEWRPYKIEVTLYGATADTYEQVTGVGGSFARCMQGIELLLDRGLPLEVKSVVLRQNRHEVAEMKEWARGMGLAYRFDTLLTPRIDGSAHNLPSSLSPREALELDLADSDRMAVWREVMQKEAARHVASDRMYACGAGQRSFHVDAYGQLSACGLARKPAYDLTAGTFCEGWRDFLGEVRQARRMGTSPCATCEIGVLCSQCPGWSQLVHGDSESVVDYVCELAHLRSANLFAAGEWTARPHELTF